MEGGGKFIEQKSGRHYLEVSKCNVIKTDSNGHLISPDLTHWEGHSIACKFPC